MSAHQTSELRIYCLCGQKMKVRADMYGRKAKCVACRQKLRIPKEGQIPEGVRELHLKDHPEFLRKARPRKTIATNTGLEVAPDEPGAPALGDDKDSAANNVPLDVLEPLRILYCLDKKVERQLEAVEQYAGAGGDASDSRTTRAELLDHLNAIDQARTKLDEILRQRLMETAIELADVEEKLAELTLSARTGEVDYFDFEERADRLRKRRDVLLRRRNNLRGWLAIESIHMAGGYREVSFTDLPESLENISLPQENEPDGPLIEFYCERLREAFEDLDRARKRLNEAKRMQDSEDGNPQAIADVRGECEARKQRLKAQIAFYRKRLRRIIDDIDMDLDHVNKRLAGRQDDDNGEQAGQLEQSAAALKRDRDIAERALHAARAQDVPRTSQSLLRRVAPVNQTKDVKASASPSTGIGYDCFIAWGAALLLVASPVLPVVNGMNSMALFWQLGLNPEEVHWFISFPVAAALALSLMALVPAKAIRGGLIGVTWLLCVTLSAFYLHNHVLQQPGVLGEQFSLGGFLQPGLLAYALGLLLMCAAGVAAMWSSPQTRLAAPVIVGAAILSLGLVLTDFAGLLRPDPRLDVRVERAPGAMRDSHRATVTIANAGRKTMIVSQRSLQPNAYTFALESRAAGDGWSDVTEARFIQAGAGRYGALSDELPRIVLPPRESATLTFGLRGGEHRAILAAATRPTQAEMVSFEVPETVVVAEADPEEPEVPAEPTELPPLEPEEETTPGEAGPFIPRPDPEQPDEEPADDEEVIREEPFAPPRPAVTEVELRGKVSAREREPRFFVLVHHTDGESAQLTLELGDPVYDGWVMEEFNPERNSVTITDGENLLILRRGERIPLQPEEQGDGFD